MHADLFTPWPVVRATREIEVLKEHGHKISVVSWIKDKSDLPSTETREDIDIHRIHFRPPKKGLLGRVLAYRRVIEDMSRKITELKPDAIVCHDLEILKAGVTAKKKLNVPLFFDAHENWPEMVKENSSFEARIFANMEKKLLKHVTHSYTYGDDLTEKYKKMGFSATTLFNSKSIDSVKHINEAEVVRFKRGLGLTDSDFIVGFAGSVNLENGIKQTLDCLPNLPEDIRYLVVGGSGREEDLTAAKNYAQKKGVEDRVIFTGRVKSKEMLELIATFQIGTALFQPLSPNHVARVPNKLFDYMALSVPMIVSDFPNMKTIVVEKSKCGVAVNPMDVKWITQAITHFHKHRDEAKEKGANGRRMFETVYSWDMQKKKLLNSHPIWKGKNKIAF
jgi:glycosyltransferase involved in cell wall biosynthesis